MTAKKEKPSVSTRVETEAPVVVCVIDGCERPVLHRGLCSAHWEDPRMR